MNKPIALKASQILLEPIQANEAQNGSMFLDISNGMNAFKDLQGNIVHISQTTAESLFIKKMILAEDMQTANRPISIMPNGKICYASTDATDAQSTVGYNKEVGLAGDGISVLLIGPNIANALYGKNFAPGKTIYLSESSGYTDDITQFTGDNDSIIKVGYSSCAAGTFGEVATDLISSVEVISSLS